jgi:AAA family ATP:ADP antiporter
MAATPSRFERSLAWLLRPFAKVEPAEAISATVLTVTVFLLLTAYYFLKTAREPLILLHGGAEVKSYAAAGQAVLLLIFVQAYGVVAHRVGRMKLLAIVYLFFAANLLVFAALAAADAPIGVPFYLWVGVFNYTAIAQFWAFAADVYTPDQGKRLFAILGIGSSVGAVAGAEIARLVVPLGPQALMLGAAVLVIICVLLFAWVNARLARSSAERHEPPKSEPLKGESAFALLVHDKYLLAIAALTLLLNWVNTNGEYLLDRTLLASLPSGTSHAQASVFIGQFKADYFAWVNIAGVLIQLFAVSRILARLGVRASLFFLPIVAFGGYTLMLVAPLLALIRVAKVAENSLDYSIQNTARQALYLVTTRVEKYVGKTAVDTFFVRIGDVFSAGLVWVGARLAFSTPTFAAMNLVLIVAWLCVVVVIGREHLRRSLETEGHVSGAPPPAVGALKSVSS